MADVRDFINYPDRSAIRLVLADGTRLYGFINGVHRIVGPTIAEGAGQLSIKVAEDGSEYVPSTDYPVKLVDVRDVASWTVEQEI